MGIQDRDYYQNKSLKSQPTPIPRPSNPNNNPAYSPPQSHHCLAKRSANNKTSIKYLIYPLIALLTLWYSADRLLYRFKNFSSANPQALNPQQPKQQPVELIAGGALLKTDRSGHFRGTALINGIEAPILIDTGATQTVIPEKIAAAAGLPIGKTIQKNTAGGQVLDHLTKIDSLKIGNAELKNLDASINQHLDEVLIGMNTLKYFRMTQEGNQLSLVASDDPINVAEIERHLPFVPAIQSTETPTFSLPEPPIAEQTATKAKTNWKKSVVCDAQKNCKTVYGDH